jgi:hypothetical protein
VLPERLTQEDFEPKLSFVSLLNDNITMMLNNNPKYLVRLPISISKKNAEDKKRIVKEKIFEGCSNFGMDYVSEDNVNHRTKEVVDQLYERARVTKNYVAPPAHPIISEWYRNNYSEFLIDCIKKTVKEENALIRQIVYTTLSPYGNDPINLGVLAPTSTGKSYPIGQSVEYTPNGKEVRKIGSMTPKVLIREQGVLVDKNQNPIGKQVRWLKYQILKEKGKKHFDKAEEYQDELAALLEDSAYVLDMSNKTLIFLEPPHPELWNLLKPILSHDSYEMEHPFVNKIASGGMEVKRVITRGWPACIFCSGKDESKWDIWPEIESRFMIQSPNIVKQKFQAGNRLIAQKKGLPRGVKQQLIISDEDKELGKQCFLYLKHQIQQYTSTTDSPVWIPFGERLSDVLPADKGQDNRSVNRFFTMLNIIALSKAHLRHKLLFDDEELIIATLQDLRETLHVMQNMSGLPPHKLRFYQQYILPLYHARDKTPLETRQICDFYNANNPKGMLKMNSNNLLKNYLQELVNHNYLEQERDDDTKAIKYLFTPLVDADEEEQKEEDQPPSSSSTSSTLGPVYQYLQFSKLLVPENYPGVPENWLKDEILQLSSRTLTDAPLKILDPKGNDIPIDEFVQSYESENGLKLIDFLKVPRLVYRSNSVDITTSEESKQGDSENITTNEENKGEKRYTQTKVDQVYRTDFTEIMQKCMLDKEGNNKGYFTKEDFIYALVMLPNKHWTENEAEQTFEQLLQQERKLVEFQEGRFKPAV